MGRKLNVTIGERFGMLTIIEYLGLFNKAKKVVCKCDCGNTTTKYYSSLTSKDSKSCGCDILVPLISGTRYGKLIAVEELKNNKSRKRLIKCQCDCGNEKIVSYGNLRSNNTRSCGCLVIPPKNTKITHGKTRTIEYNSWKAMKRRCYDINHKSYNHYGGRGIIVCDRWLELDGNGCSNFILDMGLRPSSKYSLDRIDVNGNYEPSNCRWATPKQQANNKRQKQPSH
jgi:hypothetical protein